MFSFHKPKIYRSNLGCCICKAKSSSSRFTDSKKYENEFERCFRIQEKRSGEICNACVLLVKRWKKLSAENRLIKHWHHVVDARAGPGTKLTSGRRLTSHHLTKSSVNSSANSPSSSASSSNATVKNKNNNNNNNNDFAADSSSNSSTSSTSSADLLQNSTKSSSSNSQARVNAAKSQLLPLSSNQTTNHQVASSIGSTATTKCSSVSTTNTNTTSSNVNSTTANNNNNNVRRRAGSFNSNKARAIDTNVSTFTFGETTRRSYMTPEGFSLAGSSSSLTNPQSALNSTAFESVIKRFRQRQQQQLLDAQRRQRNKQRNGLLEQKARKVSIGNKKQLPIQEQQKSFSKELGGEVSDSIELKGIKSDEMESMQQSKNKQTEQQMIACRRIKRSSESIGSISVDGLRVSSLLDSSLWRKEKVCCGIIFRGLYNEVAIFPKLLKPCQCRIQKKASSKLTNPLNVVSMDQVKDDQQEDKLLRARQLLKGDSPSPPPRAQKSGSISSCDSNTSGTGSMEEPMLDEEILAKETTPTSSRHYQGEFIYI